LLIEFCDDCYDKAFTKAILKVLRSIPDFVMQESENEAWKWDFDSTTYDISGEFGQCELNASSWGFMFILADENQATIDYFNQKLQESGLFAKEEVDFEDYK
jgi:hypothetical protein